MDAEEGDDSAADEIEFSFFPFTYYWKQAQTSPPRHISEFFDENYKHLAISGVFAALIVYLSDFVTTPSQPIIIGMVGAIIIFLISLAIVINDGLIELTQAYRTKSLIKATLYILTIYALLSIGFALLSTFGQYLTASIYALDLLIVLSLLMVFIFVVRARFTTPFELNSNTKNSITLGRYTGYIIRKATIIGPIIVIVIFYLPDMVFPRFDIQRTLNDLYPNFQSLQFLFVILLFFSSIIFVVLFAIVARLIFLKMAGMIGQEKI